MTPDLTDAEKERFAELREKLEGVSRAAQPDESRLTEFKPLNPMLAEAFEDDLANLTDSDWYAERKYDGTRIILEKFDGEVRLYTRRHVERSKTLPEVTEAALKALPDGLVIDGEVTYIDPDGNSVFIPIHGGEGKIEKYDLRPVYYVFDMLVHDTNWILRKPLSERRERLHNIVPDGDVLQPTSGVTSDFQTFFDELVTSGEEGIILKRRDSPYLLDTRSSHWQKVKAFSDRDVLAIGYTPGQGQRQSTFGALVLTDGEQYIGRVGSGFTDGELEALLDVFKETDTRPVSVSKVGMSYTPIEPLVVTVKYQDITDNTELRAPVYLGVKPDAPTDDVTPLT